MASKMLRERKRTRLSGCPNGQIREPELKANEAAEVWQ